MLTTCSWPGAYSYKATDEFKTGGSFEQVGHWSLHSRVNTTADGTYVTGQNDGTGDSEYRTSGDLVHKFATTWTPSFDGQSYGNNVNTLVE